MKSILSIMALLAGIAMSASAAVETFTAYSLDANWTNAEATVWNVTGVPRTPAGGFPAIVAQNVVVDTDESGKITGTATLTVSYNSTGVPFNRFVVNVTGRISSTPAKPSAAVTMNIKGKGYADDGTGGPTTTLSSISLKFTGEPGPNPSNPNQTRLVGSLTGTIQGKTPLNEKSTKLSGLVAYLSNPGPGFLGFSADTLATTNRLLLVDPVWSGTGFVNTKTNGYRLAAKGAGANRGASLAVTGRMGSYTNTVGANQVGFSAPVTMQGKGRVRGQAVSGTASQVNASLITN